jgi:hypothetical protein
MGIIEALSSYSITFPHIHSTHLLVILLGVVVDDVEEAELVDTLGGGDDTEPVTELLLLQELLGPAIDVSLQSWSILRGI